MDNTKESPTVLPFCVGCGGLEEGIERVFGKVTPLAYVEIEAYAIENLLRKMESGKMAPAPIWTDVKTLPLGPFYKKVDIISSGYPCQPFSSGGKGLGEKDPRHLWPFIRSAIKSIQPGMCFFENVEGHITNGLYDVLDDLGGMGYRSTWGIFSAAEVGLPHFRERLFILAYAPGIRSQRSWENSFDKNRMESVQRKIKSILKPETEGHPGIWTHQGYESQSMLLRGNDGLRDWEDRIRLIGNSVVPVTAELAFRTLWKELQNNG